MLEIDDLSKRYGPVRALDGASFTARRGRLVGFLGPNGAGKTTTMRCIFGLATPDSGTVRWDGSPIDAATRLRFGYMPEQRGLYPRMRVGEQLAYFGQHHGLSRHDRADEGRRVAGAVRARGPGEVQARGPLARQPAAGPARDGARPRPGAARPRRAVQRPRPDRHRDDGRRPAGAGRGRGRRRVLVPPARPRRGGLRGRGDHQPRAGRGRGRHRGAEGPLRPAPPGRRGRRQRRGVARLHQPPHRPRARRRPRAAPRRRDRGPRRAAGRRAGRGRGPPLQLRAAQALGAVHGGGQRAPAGAPDGQLLEALP